MSSAAVLPPPEPQNLTSDGKRTGRWVDSQPLPPRKEWTKEIGTETSRPASQETIAQRRDKTRRQPILASRHHRPTIPTSKSQTSKRRRCCRATRNHHRLPPPGAPTGNTPQRRHARPPAFPHTPSQQSSRDVKKTVVGADVLARVFSFAIALRPRSPLRRRAGGWFFLGRVRAVSVWVAHRRLAIYAGRGGSRSTTAMASSDRRWDAHARFNPSQLHCQRRCNGTTTKTATMEAMQDASWLVVEESLRLSSGSMIELSAAGVFFVALMRFNSAPGGLVASIAGSGQNLGMLTDASKCSTKKKTSTSHLNFEDCSKNARTRSEAHAARKELESAKQWDSRPGPASPPSSHGAMPRQHVESCSGSNLSLRRQ